MKLSEPLQKHGDELAIGTDYFVENYGWKFDDNAIYDLYKVEAGVKGNCWITVSRDSPIRSLYIEDVA